MKIWLLIDLAMIAMLTEDKMTPEKEPKAFEEAWNHTNKESCRKCHDAI